MSAVDRYTDWDAAYVLGALSPDERGEFEQHLAGCDRCRTSVGELAGMPGLLAQVPPAEAWALSAEGAGEPSEPQSPSSDPAPPSTVVALRPARPRWWQVAAAAVLVAVLGGLGGYGIRTLTYEEPRQRLAFSAVVPSPLTAVVDLAPVDGGRPDVRVECQYAEARAGEAYSVWVVDSRGRGSEVKPWTVQPNRVMHPSGVSDLSLDAISAVEIREGDAGQVLLRAKV